jgi:hypothetical protein
VEVDLLHSIWLEVSAEVAPLELHHHDVVHFALETLRDELSDGNRQEALRLIRQHVQRVRNRSSVPADAVA